MGLQWTKLRQTEQKLGYKWLTDKVFVSPAGNEEQFTVWGRSGAQNVATIAITRNKQVVIARQFRQGPELIFDEIPGGAVNDGEDLAVAAARELIEETGYSSDQPFLYLGDAYRDAYSNEHSSYFLAADCYKQQAQQLNHNEFVELVTISIEQLINNAKSARMSDAVAVLLALDYLV